MLVTFLLTAPFAALAEPVALESGVLEEIEPLAVSAAPIQFTCGQMQKGTFGSMLETHEYTVYLQGNKQVAFSGRELRFLPCVYISRPERF